MFYSNEVVLMKTHSCRYVNSTNIDDLDLSIDGVLHKDNAVLGSEFKSVKSRIFKIVDVYYHTSRELDITPNPTSIIIQGKYDPNVKLICKASDLLYMHKDITTIKNIISYGDSKYGIYTLGKVRKEDSYYDIADMYSYIRFNNDEHIHKKIQKIHVGGKFVDSSDVRIHSNSSYYKFIYSINLGIIIRQIVSMGNGRVQEYIHCRKCQKNALKYREFSSYGDLCRWCYENSLVECDVCGCESKLDKVKTKESLRNNRNLQLESVFIDSEVDVCCHECIESFHISCTKCKKIDYIDFELVRNSEYKSQVFRDFQHNNKEYSRIFSSIYCNNCATSRLSNYLDNPFRGGELPRLFASKSEFNRFVGIESEVITHYESASNYSEEADVPLNFEVVSDGSLNEGGVEFRTNRPIIGKTVLSALDNLEKVHRDYDNYIDSSCGVHIHMNARDFAFVEIKSLLMIMTKIQPLLYLSLPSNRGDDYCRQLEWSMEELRGVKNLPQLVTSYYNLQDSIFSDDKYNEARYVGTNIHARFLLGSIEFRYHEGTTYSSEIVEWIRFLNKIMKQSINLHSNNRLYRKIINNKTHAMDVVREITGISGAEYLENRINNNE